MKTEDAERTGQGIDTTERHRENKEKEKIK